MELTLARVYKIKYDAEAYNEKSSAKFPAAAATTTRAKEKPKPGAKVDLLPSLDALFNMCEVLKDMKEPAGGFVNTDADDEEDTPKTITKAPKKQARKAKKNVTEGSPLFNFKFSPKRRCIARKRTLDFTTSTPRGSKNESVTK